ncbi:unnamed protein product, partial [Mycena citricolor]
LPHSAHTKLSLTQQVRIRGVTCDQIREKSNIPPSTVQSEVVALASSIEVENTAVTLMSDDVALPLMAEVVAVGRNTRQVVKTTGSFPSTADCTWVRRVENLRAKETHGRPSGATRDRGGRRRSHTDNRRSDQRSGLCKDR